MYKTEAIVRQKLSHPPKSLYRASRREVRRDLNPALQMCQYYTPGTPLPECPKMYPPAVKFEVGLDERQEESFDNCHCAPNFAQELPQIVPLKKLKTMKSVGCGCGCMSLDKNVQSRQTCKCGESCESLRPVLKRCRDDSSGSRSSSVSPCKDSSPERGGGVRKGILKKARGPPGWGEPFQLRPRSQRKMRNKYMYYRVPCDGDVMTESSSAATSEDDESHNNCSCSSNNSEVSSCGSEADVTIEEELGEGRGRSHDSVNKNRGGRRDPNDTLEQCRCILDEIFKEKSPMKAPRKTATRKSPQQPSGECCDERAVRKWIKYNNCNYDSAKRSRSKSQSQKFKLKDY